MSRFSGLTRRISFKAAAAADTELVLAACEPANRSEASVGLFEEAKKTTRSEIATANEDTKSQDNINNNNSSRLGRKRRRKRRRKVMMSLLGDEDKISPRRRREILKEEEEVKYNGREEKCKMRRVFSVLGTWLVLASIYLLVPMGRESSQIVVEGAVVRPTIFSGLSPSDMMSSLSTGQPPAALVQQQSNGIAGTATASSSAFHQLANQDLHQLAHTKINPYKSRFCSNSAQPLGLQSMDLDDLALSASSYSNEMVRPQMARLNLDLAGGAWCPLKPISAANFGKEWIQVKLNRSQVISAIETQGRFGNGSGKEFVPSYTIEYSRNSGKSWHKWKDFRGSSLLRANEDVNSPVRNELSPPIVGANLVRIVPYSVHLKIVCLRFELYGCSYDEGAPIAYATSEGVVEPRWGHLIDYTYDGVRHSGRLSNGLGQLVDGVFGPSNFSHNMGFEWVGWKSMNGDLEIEFTFSSLRNFSQAQFHSNNLFSSGVEVFQAIDVYYGIDQTLVAESLKDTFREEQRRDATLRAQAEPFESANGAEQTNRSPSTTTLWCSTADVLSIEYEPDKSNEAARPVTVHLKQRLANKLRFVLKFASKWILLSEVEFISSRVELLALSSLLSSAPEREQSLALLNALTHPNSQPSTYDQYVAIVREHQLRRAAASAYLESFAPSKPTAIDTNQDSENIPLLQATPLAGSSSSSASDLNQLSLATNSYPQLDEPSTSQQYVQRRILGPAIPPHSLWQLGVPDVGGPSSPSGNMGLENSQVPSTNPMLSQLGPALFGQTLYGPTSNSILVGRPNNLDQTESRYPGLEQSGGIALGPVSAISLALVALLALIGILILISGHRFAYNRRRPKLGVVSSITKRSATDPRKPVSGLHAFLDQILHPSSGRNHQQRHLTQTASLPGRHQEPQNLYNAIFATNDRHQHTHKPIHPILPGQQQHQLLVSVKDSTSGSRDLFSSLIRASGRNQQLGVGAQSGGLNTQLIVGLNQPNPQQQQQQQQQPIYASHYESAHNAYSSAANSQPSISSHGADYAVPDAQPIISQTGGQHHLLNHYHHHNTYHLQHPTLSHQHQHQHWRQ